MKRSAYFMFTLLLTVMIYCLVYVYSPRHEALPMAVYYFSAPLAVANFIMALGSLLVWFVRQDEDISRGGVTFLHTTWIIILVTFIAFKVIHAGSLARLFSALK